MSLGPHAGHTVGVTGVVLGEDGEDDEDELEIRVTELRHIAASYEKTG